MEAAMEGLLGDPANVVRIARTLKTVDDNDYRHGFGLPGLPVAMREQTGFRIDLEQPGFGGRDIEPPWRKSRRVGHGVAVFSQRVAVEWRGGEMSLRR